MFSLKKSVALIAFLPSTVLLTACGGSGGDGGGDSEQVSYQPQTYFIEGNGIACTEYTADSRDYESNIPETAVIGTCTTINALGACTVAAGGLNTRVVYYQDANGFRTIESLQSGCDHISGRFEVIENSGSGGSGGTADTEQYFTGLVKLNRDYPLVPVLDTDRIAKYRLFSDVLVDGESLDIYSYIPDGYTPMEYAVGGRNNNKGQVEVPILLVNEANEFDLFGINLSTGALIQLTSSRWNYQTHCWDNVNSVRNPSFEDIGYIFERNEDGGCNYEDFDSELPESVEAIDLNTLNIFQVDFPEVLFTYPIEVKSELAGGSVDSSLGFWVNDSGGRSLENGKFYSFDEQTPPVQISLEGVSSIDEAITLDLALSQYVNLISYNGDLYNYSHNDLTSGSILKKITETELPGVDDSDNYFIENQNKHYLIAVSNSQTKVYEINSNKLEFIEVASFVTSERLREIKLKSIGNANVLIATGSYPSEKKYFYYFSDGWAEAFSKNFEIEEGFIGSYGNRIVISTSDRYEFADENGLDRRDSSAIDSTILYHVYNAQSTKSDNFDYFLNVIEETDGPWLGRVSFSDARAITYTPMFKLATEDYNVSEDRVEIPYVSPSSGYGDKLWAYIAGNHRVLNLTSGEVSQEESLFEE